MGIVNGGYVQNRIGERGQRERGLSPSPQHLQPEGQTRRAKEVMLATQNSRVVDQTRT